jgi:AcrR family transcriptional regulator
MRAASDIARELAAYVHGRVPRAVRERQILNVAQGVFAEQGYAGASMDEIARRAGVSKPVVYALVGTKEQLYRRCVDELSAELSSLIAEAAASEWEPGAQLRAAIGAFFRFVQQHRRDWEALAWEVTPFAAEAAAVRRRQTELVATLLAANARRVGVVVDATHVDAVAHYLNGAIEAMARWWGSHEEVPVDLLTDWALELAQPGLQGIIDRGHPAGGGTEEA